MRPFTTLIIIVFCFLIFIFYVKDVVYLKTKVPDENHAPKHDGNKNEKIFTEKILEKNKK